MGYCLFMPIISITMQLYVHINICFLFSPEYARKFLQHTFDLLCYTQSFIKIKFFGLGFLIRNYATVFHCILLT